VWASQVWDRIERLATQTRHTLYPPPRFPPTITFKQLFMLLRYNNLSELYSNRSKYVNISLAKHDIEPKLPVIGKRSNKSSSLASDDEETLELDDIRTT
jgi:hypothetical protein